MKLVFSFWRKERIVWAASDAWCWSGKSIDIAYIYYGCQTRILWPFHDKLFWVIYLLRFWFVTSMYFSACRGHVCKMLMPQGLNESSHDIKSTWVILQGVWFGHFCSSCNDVLFYQKYVMKIFINLEMGRERNLGNIIVISSYECEHNSWNLFQIPGLG